MINTNGEQAINFKFVRYFTPFRKTLYYLFSKFWEILLSVPIAYLKLYPMNRSTCLKARIVFRNFWFKQFCGWPDIFEKLIRWIDNLNSIWRSLIWKIFSDIRNTLLQKFVSRAPFKSNGILKYCFLRDYTS